MSIRCGRRARTCAGSIAVIDALLVPPLARPTVNAIGVTLATPGTLRSAARDARPECPVRGSPASSRRSGCRRTSGSTAWLIVAFVPAASTATKRHEREADRERGGRDHRAARLADRVLAREAAGDPAPARRARRSPRASAGTTWARRGSAAPAQADPQQQDVRRSARRSATPRSAAPLVTIGRHQRGDDHAPRMIAPRRVRMRARRDLRRPRASPPAAARAWRAAPAAGRRAP